MGDTETSANTSLSIAVLVHRNRSKTLAPRFTENGKVGARIMTESGADFLTRECLGEAGFEVYCMKDSQNTSTKINYRKTFALVNSSTSCRIFLRASSYS
jgi:hypothetical protein